MTFADVPLFFSLQEALAALFGNHVKVARSERVVGGDINQAFRLTLDNGMAVFMKVNRRENAAFFAAEAEGLRAIAQTGAIGTPGILCRGTDTDGYAFLMLELIAGARRIPDYQETFARELAAMHRADTAAFAGAGRYGFHSDNYIGSGEQSNAVHDSWTTFFRDCRLAPQFRRAEGYLDAADRKRAARLLEKAADILVEPPHPSLLHGDLWSGNVMTGDDGKAWLIDPASYVGHAEADLAMTELFGRFSQTFYDAYREAAPLQPGYAERRDFYNLYHLLNHLNLFGASYLPSVRRIMRKYG